MRDAWREVTHSRRVPAGGGDRSPQVAPRFMQATPSAPHQSQPRRLFGVRDQPAVRSDSWRERLPPLPAHTASPWDTQHDLSPPARRSTPRIPSFAEVVRGEVGRLALAMTRRVRSLMCAWGKPLGSICPPGLVADRWQTPRPAPRPCTRPRSFARRSSRWARILCRAKRLPILNLALVALLTPSSRARARWRRRIV